MVNADLAKAFVREGRNYLLSLDGVSEAILDQHINDYNSRHEDINSLSDSYKVMLKSVRSLRHMPKVIDDVDNFSEELFNFEPGSIVEHYENDHRMLFKAIAPAKTKYRAQNSWVKFCKSAMSGAHFLSQFKNYKEFIAFTQAFTAIPETRIGLALLLKEEVFGFGFALACDFIKESVSPEYVKPDTHIKYIFKELGICRDSASDYEVFKDVVVFSEIAQEKPYTVDKLFWLIGSGKFYYINRKVKTNRQNFVERLKKNLAIL